MYHLLYSYLGRRIAVRQSALRQRGREAAPGTILWSLLLVITEHKGRDGSSWFDSRGHSALGCIAS